jgi:hypothetical protein
MNRMRRFASITALVLTTGTLAAQTPASLQKAAESITKEDVARHVGLIADDSMQGRGTPSRGLELTAQYVAEQFQKLGLKPGGDNGSWIQRFPLPRDSSVTAPNTVSILEGSDPKLKNEYVVFVAHMDHLGARGKPGQADSIYNGADDNASGTAGVIELAKAFSRSGVRPRRSMIFLTVGGEERGLLGSRHFVEHPPVPFQQIVATIDLDMIGRNWADSVMVLGLQESELGAIVSRVEAAHPQLRMASVPLKWRGGSDHIPFAERGVPVLVFSSYLHKDYHQYSDSPEKIDAEKTARLLHLVFYVGQEVANVDRKPQWDSASYTKHAKRANPIE